MDALVDTVNLGEPLGDLLREGLPVGLLVPPAARLGDTSADRVAAPLPVAPKPWLGVGGAMLPLLQGEGLMLRDTVTEAVAQTVVLGTLVEDSVGVILAVPLPMPWFGLPGDALGDPDWLGLRVSLGVTLTLPDTVRVPCCLPALPGVGVTEEQGEEEVLTLVLPEVRGERDTLVEKEGEGDVLTLPVPIAGVRDTENDTVGVPVLLSREMEGQAEALRVTEAHAEMLGEALVLGVALTEPEALLVVRRFIEGEALGESEALGDEELLVCPVALAPRLREAPGEEDTLTLGEMLGVREGEDDKLTLSVGDRLPETEGGGQGDALTHTVTVTLELALWVVVTVAVMESARAPMDGLGEVEALPPPTLLGVELTLCVGVGVPVAHGVEEGQGVIVLFALAVLAPTVRVKTGEAEALGGAFVGEMLGVVDRLPLRDTPGLLETLGLAEKEGV